MSILIEGMEMPKEGTVIAVYKIDGKLYATRGLSGRLYPLVPVPPHGDLVERDAINDVLIKLVENRYPPKVFATWMKYNVPTIIPADHGYSCTQAQSPFGIRTKTIEVHNNRSADKGV